MSLLKEVDILGDPISFVVIQHHLGGEIDKLARVKTTAVGIEVVDECFCSDIGVEGATVMEVTVPKFVDRFPDEFSRGVFSGFEGSIIVDKDGVFCLGAGADDRSGVVGNNRVSWWLGGDGERHTPSGGIRGRWLDDADKVVQSRVIVRDLQEEGVEDVPKRCKVIVGGLANDGLEQCRGRGKGRSDFLGCHGVWNGSDRGVGSTNKRTNPEPREGRSGVRCGTWQRIGQEDARGEAAVAAVGD